LLPGPGPVGAREEPQMCTKGAIEGPQRSPVKGARKGHRWAEEIAVGVLEKKKYSKKEPPGGREGSYSAPGGAKGGPRKGLRRAEEGAVSVLEKRSKKEDKIKEWGPQRRPQEGFP
jgi:hypothetical protein